MEYFTSYDLKIHDWVGLSYTQVFLYSRPLDCAVPRDHLVSKYFIVILACVDRATGTFKEIPLSFPVSDNISSRMTALF